LVGSIFHMTRKIVSEMTYNVSMGTLNPTIPIPLILRRVYATIEEVGWRHTNNMPYQLSGIAIAVRGVQLSQCQRLCDGSQHE